MTEDLGTPTRPHVLTGEQWRLEVRTDDPASSADDERWIRSDLDDGDRIATLKCGDGTEIPLFDTGTAEDSVREARRYQVGGQTVYAPIAPVDEAAFPARRVQHDGQIHAFHDRVVPGSAIPDSAINRWRIDEGSGTTFADAIGTADFSVSGGSWVSDQNAEGGYRYSLNGTDDFATATVGIGSRSVLFLATTIQTTSTATESVVLGWGSDAPNGEVFLQYNPGGNGYMKALVGNGSQFISATGSTAVNDGAKHRVGLYFDENSEVGVTVDGVTDATTAFGTIGDPSNTLALGRYESGPSNYFEGDPDHPILYSERSTSTIQDDYNAQPWA